MEITLNKEDIESAIIKYMADSFGIEVASTEITAVKGKITAAITLGEKIQIGSATIEKLANKPKVDEEVFNKSKKKVTAKKSVKSEPVKEETDPFAGSNEMVQEEPEELVEEVSKVTDDTLFAIPE